MAWTEERIAKLKQGWESGMTATQIAEMLGEGVTRNAVIGKAHRLGLESRPSPVKAADAAPAPRETAREAAPATRATPPAREAAPPVRESAPVREVPKAPAAPMAPASASAPAAMPAPEPARAKGKGGKQTLTTLLDLNDKVCKWPIGHPGDADFHFCGRPANPGFPYCGDHCLVAYQAQMPRRDRPRPLPPLPGAPRR